MYAVAPAEMIINRTSECESRRDRRNEEFHRNADAAAGSHEPVGGPIAEPARADAESIGTPRVHGRRIAIANCGAIARGSRGRVSQSAAFALSCHGAAVDAEAADHGPIVAIRAGAHAAVGLPDGAAADRIRIRRALDVGASTVCTTRRHHAKRTARGHRDALATSQAGVRIPP